MRKCVVCAQPIVDDGTTERQRWCQSMRGILLIRAVQPEDCHQHCFLAAALGGDSGGTFGAVGGRRNAAARVNPVALDAGLAAACPGVIAGA